MNGRRVFIDYRHLYVGAAVATWLASAVVIALPSSVLEAVAGLLLTLALPGVLILYAFVPPLSGLDWRVRATLSVVLSVAIALFVGLTLALVIDRVPSDTAAIALSAVATVAALIADRRTMKGDLVDFTLPTLPTTPVAALVGTVAAIGVCIWVIVTALGVKSPPGTYTALSLTREAGDVKLLIQNRTDETNTYTYELRASGREMLAQGDVQLAPGEDRAVLADPGKAPQIDGVLIGASGQPERAVTLRLRR